MRPMNLRTLRTERKLSQAELAAQLGWKSKASVSEVEKTGRASPDRALKIEKWSEGAILAETLSPVVAMLRAP